MSTLAHIEGRIIIKVDLEGKNWHRMPDGKMIRLERKYDCFDNCYTKPVNGIVVSAEHIPVGSEVIIHHNSTHATNEIFNYHALSGEVEADTVKYYSITTEDAFVYRDKDSDQWNPLPGYDFALRVFRPYFGPLQGIEPELIKNTLLLTTGDFKGLVCHTIKYVDYTMVFQNIDQREHRLIRVRTNGNEKTQREEEISCINHKLTDEYNAGKIYAGLTKSDCKPKNELVHA